MPGSCPGGAHSRYGIIGELKCVGLQLVGRCPIHAGSNPKQFVVGSHSWHCFGDSLRGGSTLDFVALRENVTIPAAANLIAGWFAIPTLE
jgi:hypothetical protein